MKSFLPSKVSLLLALSLFAVAQKSYAGVFQNGSFESPALSPGAGISMSAGSDVLPGWQISGPGLVGLGNGSTAVSAVSPVDGSQHFAFNVGDSIPGASISQTFNTVAGQSYRISFYVGRTGPGSGVLGLLTRVASGSGEALGSLAVAPPATAGYGSAQSFTFTAIGTNSTVTFADTSSATTAIDLLLDNVTMTEVVSPESHAFANGSFESPALAPGSVQVLTTGSAAISGWKVGGAGPVGWWNGPILGVTGVDGAQHIDFNGGDTTPGAAIFQTFSTTIGQAYVVRFNVGRTGSGSGTLGLLADVTSSGGVSLGSLSVVAQSSPGYGSEQTFNFTATTSTSTLTFRDTSSATVAVDLLLDNVAVTEVVSPEPRAFVNGSFESPALSAGAGISMSAGSDLLVGWRISGPGLVGLGNGSTAVSAVNPVDGSQHLAFNVGNSIPGASISQTFNTVAGQSYRVSFYVGRTGPGSGALGLFASVTSGTSEVLGSLGVSPPATAGYGPAQSFTFTATTANSTLTFTDTSSATTALDLLLDNVSVTEIISPEPHAFMNGSFELPALAADASVDLPAGSTFITGWTVGNTGLVAWRNGPAYGVAPVDGSQEIGFNGADTPPGGSISQTFSTTVGQTYEVRFNVGRQGSGSGTMSLLAELKSGNGAVLGSLNAAAPGSPGYGASLTFTFTATTSTSTLTFTDTSSATVAVDVLLDNVSVTPVTECIASLNGLVGWWRAEGNAADNVSSSVGTLSGGATFDLGEVGRAFSFDGTGEVRIDDALALNVQQFTVDAWVYPTALDGEVEIIVNKEADSSNPKQYEIGIRGSANPNTGSIPVGHFTFHLGGVVGLPDEFGGWVDAGSVPSNQWSHVALTFDSTTAKAYVNGLLTRSVSNLSGTLNVSSGPLRIGSRSPAILNLLPNERFNGLIDEVDLFDRALSAGEIQAIFNAGSAGKCVEACAAPPSGLVSWWSGNGNANDVVSGNNGTLQGQTSYAAGKVGQAFSFDGDHDAVSIGNPANLQLQSFTIEAWIKRTSSSQISAASVFGEILGYGLGGYVFGLHNDGRLFLSRNGVSIVNSTRAVVDTNWHHIAVSRSGSTVVFYVDGAGDPPLTYGDVFTFSSNLAIGAVNDDFGASFLGLIDELAVFNRALAASEIQSIFAAGSEGKCAPTTPQTTAIAHWKFDETGGSTAHDSAGSFDGTLSSGGASFVSGGISGNALSLNKGTNGFVNMGNVLGLTGDFSIVSWVKTNPGDTTEGSAVVGKHAADYVNGYFLMLNNSGGYGSPGKAFFYNSSFPGQEVTSTSSVNDGQWHQVVAVYESGGSALIYVDGAPAEASKISRSIVANAVSFLVGGVNFNGVPTGLFTGLIDDVQIYSVALSPTNVDFLFHNPSKEVPAEDLPARQWQLTTVAGAGGSITRDPDLAKYTDGATVTLTANPNAGFAFTGWNGDASGTANPITITMTGNKTVTANFQSVPVGKALAHWKFDEASGTVARDSAGPFNGNLSPGGASFVSGGASGNALSLSRASNGFVNMGNVLGLTSGDFSIVTWVKTNPGDTTEGSAVVGKHAANYVNGYFLMLNNSGNYGAPGKALFYNSSFPGQEVTSTSSVNDGQWHQIVAVYESGGSALIYVDGAPAEASKASRSIVANTASFLVGGVNFDGVPTGLFTGLIDDVQIYNYALRPSDVDLVFQNPGQEIPPRELPPGQWRLTIVAGVGGTVTKDPDLSKYTNGASVSVTAVPNPAFAFVGWSGDATGTNNPITVTMTGNKTVTASFAEIPARILAVVNPDPKQEGQKINFDLRLISQGDVGGMNFVLHYNPDYLKDPKLDWSSSVGSALDQVNYDTPGEIRATFALPATAVPAGTQRVASVSFRARSVPFDLNTDLGLELVDVSAPTGDPIRSGNAARGGVAHILVRHIIGDNNANDRLDVGDATIMQRLLTGLDQVRSWDVSGNDVNANTTLDSGDVIRVLRVVADIDPQPAPQAGSSAPSGTRIAKAGLGKAAGYGSAELSPNSLRAQVGDLITVQVRLQDLPVMISGVSFTLEYPTNALRLLNSGSHRTGSLVSARAVAIWNVQPAQNNYTLQNGRVSVAMSSATAWSTNAGVLAEFTFQVQVGQSNQYCWPIRLNGAEASVVDGYDVFALPDRQICYIGRDPLPPMISVVTNGLSAEAFTFTLQGETGVSYVIETTSDLVNWTPLYTLQSTNGSFNVIDTEAKNFSQRFYRAKQQ